MSKKRIRTPTLLQMEAVECGAAALGIILGYYKRHVPLEELRNACGVSRNGSNVLNIKNAAQNYGLRTRVFRRSYEELKKNISACPCIILWQFNHFVVVEGFSKTKAYINDPARGPLAINLEEFKKGYSDIVLTFEKLPTFQKGGSAPSPFPGLLSRVQRIKRPIVYLLFLGFGLMLTSALTPIFTKIFFDFILGWKLYTWGFWFTLFFLAIVLLIGCFTLSQQLVLIRLNGKLSVQNSARYLWHILRLPLSFYQQRFGGEIAFRSSLNDEVTNTITTQLAQVVLNCLFLFIYAFLMIYINVTIALIGIVSAGLNFLCIFLTQRKGQDFIFFQKHIWGKYLGFAIGGLSQIESIKSSGGEHGFFTRLSGYFSHFVNTEQDIARIMAPLNPLFSFLSVASSAALFGVGGYLIIYEDFTLGLFMAMQSLLNGFMQPVGSLVHLGKELQTLQTNITRLDDVLKNPIDSSFTSPSDIKIHSTTSFEGYIEMRNITFGYSPLEAPLIENFNLLVKPGERIAFVGPTGCGKTTLLRLINGLFKPWSGEILIGHKDRRELSSDLIAQLVGTVDQDIFLFSGTIKNNLTLFDTTVTEEEMIRAAKDAMIHDDIMLKPKGYHFTLEAGGTNISGGQRQRLEIARGLLLNPKILILDEATSALDSYTEEKIINKIRRRGYTALMVAHRLSTIRDCDQIIVLDRGKVAQRGTHEALKKEEGIYRELVMKESSG